MKIAILGNGSIGNMLAFKISKSGHNVTQFGSKNRYGSASLAAGAMINCLAEVEENQLDYRPLKQKFDLAYNSQRKWDKFISSYFKKDENKKFKKRYTTVFTNNFTTPYEKKQFEYLKKIQSNFPKDIKTKKLKNNEIILPRERFIDSRIVINRLDELLKKNKVKVIYDIKSYKLKKINKKIEISYQGKTKKFDYVIVALGSFTQEFNTLNKQLVGNIPRIFFGVGSALSILKKPFTKNFSSCDYVLRTMNRGSACGFHLIPLSKNELYFGASNAITQIKENFSRIGSISVLTNGLIDQFSSDLKDNHLELRLGFRPTTADCYPLLGPLNDHQQIIYATGNKRDGLTSSLEISEVINDFINGDKYAFEKYSLFKPNRKLISYYNREIATQIASETSVAGQIMHNKQLMLDDWKKMVKKKKNFLNKFYDKKKISNFGIHPELISMYKFNRI